MANNSLPPFGIRGLYSPSTPFSVLQISEREYGETVRSHPDSALTWLDEDDGETITVGTGWELRERLADDPARSAPKITFYNTDTKEHENRYVHLFDISRSQASVDVWREHEAYFTKTQNPLPKQQEQQSIERSSESPTEVKNDDKLEDVVEDIAADSAVSATSPKAEPESPVTSPVIKTSKTPEYSLQTIAPEIADSLGKHLGHLADFLQTTADTLRKAADKTREADTTPIQDVLTGMSVILGEVGSFGLDVVEKVREAAAHEPKSEPSAPSQPPMPVPRTSWYADATIPQSSLTRPVPLPAASFQRNFEWNRFSSPMSQYAEQLRQQEQQNTTQFLHRKRDEEMRLLQDLKTLDEDWERSNAVNTDPLKIAATASYYDKKKRHYLKVLEELRVLISSHQALPSTVPSIPLAKPTKVEFTNPRPIGAAGPVTKSILDQEAEAADADFAARYPPLMSLRRAKTVGALRESNQQQPAPFLSNFASDPPAAARPSPQVFDAETQRRKAFALSCFPGQKYTPGPGTTYRRLPGLRKPLFTTTATEIPEPSSDEVSVSQGGVSSMSQSLATSQTSLANVSQDLEDHKPTNDNPEDKYRPLPGAWPDARADKSCCMPTPESSGAFFNRMVKNADAKVGEFPSMGKAAYVENPLRRYGSLASPANKPKRTGELRRAQTVTATTNPAARLNGPFDPIYPAPVTMQTTEEEEPLLPKSNNGPTRYAHRDFSDRRPRSLYEPYKSMPQPRGLGFEPVWEDSLHGRLPDTESTVVFIDAEGFAPDTTEQSIRDLVAYEFNREVGQNALISCRITAIEPVVLAKLVVKHKSIADKIIARLDGHTVGKHTLRLEYTKRGIDGRINRTRGVITDQDVEKDRQDRQIRPMQSLPNFASANLHRSSSAASKPLFIDFQSRSRPVSLREPFPPPMSKASEPTKPKRAPKVETKAEAATEHGPKPETERRASVSYPALLRPSRPVNNPTPIELCTSALRDMGYGSDDQELEARLKIYAAAAHGVVEDAIEMIEQDQQATHGVKLADDEVPDGYDSDLEAAIKKSMEEQ